MNLPCCPRGEAPPQPDLLHLPTGKGTIHVQLLSERQKGSRPGVPSSLAVGVCRKWPIKDVIGVAVTHFDDPRLCPECMETYRALLKRRYNSQHCRSQWDEAVFSSIEGPPVLNLGFFQEVRVNFDGNFMENHHLPDDYRKRIDIDYSEADFKRLYLNEPTPLPDSLGEIQRAGEAAGVLSPNQGHYPEVL